MADDTSSRTGRRIYIQDIYCCIFKSAAATVCVSADGWSLVVGGHKWMGLATRGAAPHSTLYRYLQPLLLVACPDLCGRPGVRGAGSESNNEGRERAASQ